MEKNDVYLGDAVYASYDGYHIWLGLNDHRNKKLIALEPNVLAALIRYIKQFPSLKEELNL